MQVRWLCTWHLFNKQRFAENHLVEKTILKQVRHCDNSHLWPPITWIWWIWCNIFKFLRTSAFDAITSCLTNTFRASDYGLSFLSMYMHIESFWIRQCAIQIRSYHDAINSRKDRDTHCKVSLQKCDKVLLWRLRLETTSLPYGRSTSDLSYINCCVMNASNVSLSRRIHSALKHFCPNNEFSSQHDFSCTLKEINRT